LLASPAPGTGCLPPAFRFLPYRIMVPVASLTRHGTRCFPQASWLPSRVMASLTRHARVLTPTVQRVTYITTRPKPSPPASRVMHTTQGCLAVLTAGESLQRLARRCWGRRKRRKREGDPCLRALGVPAARVRAGQRGLVLYLLMCLAAAHANSVSHVRTDVV
jgi:hypothetical protein